ncbi:forkhead box protein M1 isoform X2 [Chiloscyllium punctatum]|uniref:Forkhead box protein M1 n=2 Tax=Chiloscyllium punctatum TaxID=137246 RepID=A0A401T0T2_CHIPU|nr:hypothetical protein [Chiloscyllium punctatum]
MWCITEEAPVTIMKASPRRPLILKRRKRPLTFNNPVDIKENPPEDKNDGSKYKPEPTSFDTDSTCSTKDDLRHSQKHTAIETQKFPERIRIVNHPSLPNTQVVLIPKDADLQSIIAALTAKGKESGSNGPKKFILLSGNATSSSRQSQSLESDDPCAPLLGKGKKSMELQEEPSLTVANSSGKLAIPDFISNISIKKEDDFSVQEPQTPVPSSLYDQEAGTVTKVPEHLLLDDSLTNIQWLGKMSTDSLGACSVKDEAEKENQEPPPESATLESVHERPPYSYMAMIQFAINSTQSKRMTLKEIYTWIEDHFPYFKHVAKPGWKNSIRHNLSLHDMFIRQTSHNGKISHWTIRAEANRFLTLDQVVKSSDYSPTDQTHWIQAVPVLVCQQQQKRTGTTELPKSNVAASTEVNLRKMKPLLPRTDSYLVPIQLPVSSSLILQPSSHITLPTIQGHHSSTSSSSELARKRKRVRIAPKVSNESLSCNHPATSIKNTEKLMLIPPIPPVTDSHENSAAAKPYEVSKESSSRRKQRHVLQPVEEPVLLFPEASESMAESGLDLGFVSGFNESRTLDQCSDFASTTIDYNFKTPIKEKPHDLPSSSTPSKGTSESSPVNVANSWKIALTPLKKDDNLFEFSPVRTPCGSFLTPLRNNTGYLSFSSTPFKDFALFESPRELLNSPVKDLVSDTGFSPLSEGNSGRCSRELQINANTKALTEGLVLDTLNDSLSKILLDISFTGLEDEDYELGNMSWSTLIPELR